MGGVVAAATAAVCFAVFQTVQRRALRGIDVFRATASVLAVAAGLLCLVAARTGGVGDLTAAPALAVASCAAAGVVHFGLGWTLLGVSQVRLGAARTGVLVGAVPLFGALVAALALDEPLGPARVAALAVTVGGVVLVVTRPTVATGGRSTQGDRIGALAGLGTAACWSVSPILIRGGLDGVGSPITAAAIGMVSCAVLYGAGVLVVGRGRRALPVASGTIPLLATSGTAVGVAILLQWTAYGLATVAVVLAVLQLTPPLVVAMAARLAGDPLGDGSRRRVWAGAALTALGSLVLVLLG